MNPQDRYDSLVRYHAEICGLEWRRIKAQLSAESGMDPKAVSPAGAEGLAQFVRPTWEQWHGGDPFNPEHSIEACCKYMAHLYSCYGEIPDSAERYKFALAAYNAGRWNINRCLDYARQAAGTHVSFGEWAAAGRPRGPWQEWNFASRCLSLVTGENANETIGYVAKIMRGEK